VCIAPFLKNNFDYLLMLTVVVGICPLSRELGKLPGAHSIFLQIFYIYLTNHSSESEDQAGKNARCDTSFFYIYILYTDC
jgi:hypothetical protein